MAREKQTREKMLSFRVTPSEYNYYTAKAAEEAEKQRLEAERLAAQIAAEEKRKAIIQRQKELNEERKRQAEEKQKIYSLFEDDNTDKLYDKIINGKFSIPDWISPKAKSFLLGVLDTSPERRFTVEKIRESEWYNMYQIIDCVETLLINKYVIPIDESIVDEMNKKFCYRKEEIRRNILGNHHNYITSMYYLILKRKTRNGDESISDLSSVKFVSYIKDSGNLLSNYNNDIDIVIRERAKKLTSQRSDITNTNSTSASLTVNEITNVSSFERFVIELVPPKQIASRNQTMLSKTKPVSKINTKKFITVHNSKANISRYNKLKPKKKDNNKKFNIKCNFFNTTMIYEKDENKNRRWNYWVR